MTYNKIRSAYLSVDFFDAVFDALPAQLHLATPQHLVDCVFVLDERRISRLAHVVQHFLAIYTLALYKCHLWWHVTQAALLYLRIPPSQ